MDDNNKPQQQYIGIAPDEFRSGHSALDAINLALFLYRTVGPSRIEAAGHAPDAFANLIDCQVQIAKGSFEPSPRQ